MISFNCVYMFILGNMLQRILPPGQVEEENDLAWNDPEFLRLTGTMASLIPSIWSQSDVTPHSITPELRSMS